MRVKLSKNSKDKLFLYLKKSNSCNSMKELADKMGKSFNTLQNWQYRSEYLPEEIIPEEIKSNFKILGMRENNWGKIKGGKKTYKTLIKRYGIKEIRKRQINGGKKAIKNLQKQYPPFNISLSDHRFLEFYGALLGDGWLSRLNKKRDASYIWLIGLSGHFSLDKRYHLYMQKLCQEIFERKGYIKERPKYNSRELQIGHRALLEFLNKRLNFPIGTKKNLIIPKEITGLDFKEIKFVLKGLFDTDGTFFLDKTPVGKPYPIISIHMRAPILIGQLKDILYKEGFKPQISHGGEEIRLKGSLQLKRWMEKIGSSNPKHLEKINAHVAQLDSAKAS